MGTWTVRLAMLLLLGSPAALTAQEIEEEDLDQTAPTTIAPPDATTSGLEATGEERSSPFEELESLAEQKYLDGDLDTASQLYQQLAELSADPGVGTRFLLLAAWLEHQLDKPWKAKALLTQALVVDFELEFAAENYTQEFVDLYNESRALAEQEIRALTAEVVRQALGAIERGDLVEARRRLDEALARVPDEPFALYNLALVEQREGNREAATSGYERLFALERGRPGSLTPQLREQASLNLGMLYFSRGFTEDAETYLEAALTLDPSNARAWNTLGLARDQSGQTADAERAFQRALEIEPENPLFANNLASIFVRAERWMDAVALLLEASRRIPEEPSVWLNLGIAQRGMKNLEGAVESFSHAMEHDPDGSRGARRPAAVLLVPTYYRLERFSQAIDLAERVLAGAPGEIDTLVYKGLAEKSIGDQAAAEQSLSRAAELAPERADVQNNLGSVLLVLREYRAAEVAFRKALELRPGFPEAETNLLVVEELLEKQRYAGAQPGKIRDRRTDGANRRPIGVRFSEDVDYASMGLHGVLVDHVAVGGTGHRAGIRAGDIILQVDGYKVSTPAEFLSYVYQKAQGKRTSLDILRNGKPVKVTLDVR